MPGKRTAITAILLLLTVSSGILVLPASTRAATGVSVNGFVYDRTGLPVANATVTLLMDSQPLPTTSNPATTDLNGYYNFFGIQHGIYCLEAEKNSFSSSATILVQSSDKTTDLTLQGSAADLADIRVTMVPPSPTTGPEFATARPTAVTTPGPSASPGFAVVIALAGLFFTGLVKRRKQ